MFGNMTSAEVFGNIFVLLIFVVIAVLAVCLVNLLEQRKRLLEIIENRQSRENTDAETDEPVVPEPTIWQEMEREQEKEKYFLENYSGLASILNKNGFYRQTKRLLEKAKSGEYVIVCFDIENFKTFNDMHSVDAGNRCIEFIGKKLNELYLTELATCAHFGADDFAICMQTKDFDENGLVLTMKKWMLEFMPEHEFKVFYGVYVIENPKMKIEDMCDCANMALKKAKRDRQDAVCRYSAEMRDRILTEQMIINEFPKALGKEQFVVYFQPQYYRGKNLVAGAEALVRWNHPRKGMIYPGVFIPVLEQSGLIAQLDLYVVKKVCEFLEEQREVYNGKLPIHISVNVSRSDSVIEGFADKIITIIEQYRIPKSAIHIEITESAYVENPERIFAFISKIKKYGLMVEMDDFGSGYSSLNALKDLPIDVIKLDMRFLSGGHEENGQMIIRSLIRMMKIMHKKVVAEGVETRSQNRFLKNIDCDYMQGYYYSKPIDTDSFLRLLKTSGADDAEREKTDILADFRTAFLGSDKDSVMFECIGAAAIIEYTDGNVEAIMINDKFYETLGISRDFLSDKLNCIQECVPQKGREKMLEMFESLKYNEFAEYTSGKFYLGNGELKQLKFELRRLVYHEGVYIVLMTVNSVPDAEYASGEAKHSELFRRLAQIPGTVSYDYSCKTDRLDINVYHIEDGMQEYSFDDFIKNYNTVHPRIPEQSLALIRNTLSDVIETGESASIECMLDLYNENKPIYVRIHYTAYKDENGKVSHIFGNIENIHEEMYERLQKEEQLRIKARQDAVTGIFNRAASEEIIDELLSGGERGIMFVFDIDNFKLINDNYGHLFGDKMLRAAVEVLKNAISENSILGRVGGDEFVLFHKGSMPDSEVRRRIDALLKKISEIECGAELKLRCSVGGCISGPEDQCFSDLFAKADKALYEAKKNGKNQAVIYDFHPEM